MKPENGCRGGSSLASSVTNNGHWIWSLIPRPTESTLPQQGENPLWDYLVDLLQQPEFKSQLICLRKLEFSRNPKNYPKSCCEVVFVYTNFRSCSAWKQMGVSVLLCPSNLVTFGTICEIWGIHRNEYHIVTWSVQQVLSESWPRGLKSGWQSDKRGSVTPDHSTGTSRLNQAPENPEERSNPEETSLCQDECVLCEEAGRGKNE